MVVRYSSDLMIVWNSFLSQAKNALFMFHRDYMEYHADRFNDHSLLFYDSDNELIALLPMSERDGVLYSHGGLTFGGFICDCKMKQYKMMELVTELKSYMHEKSYARVIYKAIPHIYHTQPAEEDRYALFAEGARQIKVEPTTTLALANPIKMPKGRKAQISRAKREGVTVEGSSNLQAFFDLENEVLQKRHQTTAVHSAEEMQRLIDKFPDNIKLLGAYKEGKLLAATLLYVYDNLVHTQYMAASDEGREVGALDLIIYTVIESYKGCKSWLDFGISTEMAGTILNSGLISQKEGFGGRTVIHETWEINI